MSTVAYAEVLDKARRLPLADQMRLLEELTRLVRHAAAQSERSILELQGLGKEIWQEIDAQEYVNQERASWNG